MDIVLERVLSLIPKDKSGKYVHGEKVKFAKSIGYNDGSIVSMWENGSSVSYTKKLHQIASTYNVSVEWLEGKTDDPAIKKERPALTFGESHNFQECNFMFWSVFVGLCAKREVSPNAVAKALGLSSGSVTLWKNGAVPRSTTIKKIADYFGVSPESFLAGTDDPAIKKAPGINAEGLSVARKALLDAVDGLTDEQCEKLLGIVLEAKRVL